MAASVTTMVMKPLLDKLTKLLGEEYKKLAGVRRQASFLRDELNAMKALLEKMELMDKLDPSAKNWKDNVREMSYDMENCIDDFMHEIEGAHEKAGFIKKMAQRLRRLGRRHQIANRIEELKVLAVEANARRERYKIDDLIGSSPSVVAIDPRMPAIYKEATSLVGIDGPREELISLLMDSQKKLKVVSIVGFGGLGKTILAKQVFDEIGGKFDCMAFVSVSQRPDVKSLLIGLLWKLGMGELSHALELQDIIDRLREYLRYKRYFIIVDDLWDQSVWKFISCAFPENSSGSRVMVTTRLDDVAVVACHNDQTCIYMMKRLEEQASRILFFNGVFGSENVCPPQLQDISAQILSKCGGLPLAIVTIASILASHKARSLNEWESIKNSLGAKFATKPPLAEMRDILNLSYMHLPIHLRPCFLYLGMFPEDREIYRDDLVRLWIAEGFICRLHGADLDDIAKSYFNELINRSLIQPEKIFGGEVLSCRVHDMMLDLILSKSAEDNFMSVAYNYEDMASLHSCEYKVRRLSLKSSDVGATSETLSTSMSQVRSYAQFGNSTYTPPFSKFKYLQVLVFEFPDRWDRMVDLAAIGHLFLLRYLRVLAKSAEVALPTEIEKLVHLEALELFCRTVQSFPSNITCLANLICLVLPRGTLLPEGTQNMKSVRTLHCSVMSKDINGLSNLTNLKELKLSTPYGQSLTASGELALVSSIGKFRDLKDLSLHFEFEYGCYGTQMDSLPDPPPCLEVLDLETWAFERVSKWIGELRCLRILRLCVIYLSSEEVVHVLGGLPSLISASIHMLYSEDSYEEEVDEAHKVGKVMVGTGLFPVLENFSIRSNGDVTSDLSFEAGAMPKLQKLSMRFRWNVWRGATPVGMEYLPSLQEILVRPQHASSVSNTFQDMESAFKTAASAHPRHPSVKIMFW